MFTKHTETRKTKYKMFVSYDYLNFLITVITKFKVTFLFTPLKNYNISFRYIYDELVSIIPKAYKIRFHGTTLSTF